MSEQDAIAKFVFDGAYVSYDTNTWRRGPSSLMREIIRQGRRDLWLAAKFSAHDATLLVSGGCVSKIDVGWMEVGSIITNAMNEGRLKMYEWTNGALAYRHLAGALECRSCPALRRRHRRLPPVRREADRGSVHGPGGVPRTAVIRTSR